MDCVGICGSDVHYLVHGKIGKYVMKDSMIIGHEASGVVAKCGELVENLKVGDRVAIEPGVCCRLCDYCKRGVYNLCPKMRFCATPPVHGNLTRFYAHAADFCFKLPKHMTMEEGAMLEPLAVGVHSCKRANVTLGSEVLVLGAGPIGLVTIMVAEAMGASKIMVTDHVDERLTIATEVGATHTLKVSPDQTEDEIVNLIHTMMESEPDKTINCSGSEATARLALLVTRAGGIAVMVGLGADEAKLPLMTALSREIDIRGIFRYANEYVL